VVDYLCHYNQDTTSRGRSIVSKPEIFITFRVTQEEKDLLKQYCEQAARNQTDTLRELIRTLKRRLR
jgi:hypothetical protein